MAEVLPFPHSVHGASHFGDTPLHRSCSHSSLQLPNSEYYQGSTSNLKSGYSSIGYDNRPSTSLPSSAPSSPRLGQPQFSNEPSYTSTPSSSLSLDEDCSEEDEDINFPSYQGDSYQAPNQEDEPPNTPEECASQIVTPSEDLHDPVDAATVTKLGPSGSAGDDMDIKREPTRHVDYLSHNWKEEDIWSSWKHVVARRKVYGNSIRLENASWRTWAKCKYRLETVSPETLNWMKDHDVTWLYGPLQTHSFKTLGLGSIAAASGLSLSNSFAFKKPILKKRTPSELMLRRSLSSSTLIQQATDALRAQDSGRQLKDRSANREQALSDSLASLTPETGSTPSIVDDSSTSPSASTSGRQTPCTERHIHFNNKVEQCIAINGADHRRCYHGKAVYDDSDSDDEVLMMKRVPSTRKFSNPSTPRNSFSNEGKTIAMLPSTTLNYRGDTPDPIKQEEKQKDGVSNKKSRIPQCPSQETIKPSSSSSNFLLDDEDEELDMNWQPSAGRRDSVFLHHSQMSGPYDDEADDEQRHGLRRTPSGMFMPYDDEGDTMATGFLGKVIDTVNTAKDIAHVIWNVGWRGRGGGRRRGGGSSVQKVPLNGLFSDAVWHCNCAPRLPAQRFQTKNGGKNHGRWFYTCQQAQPKRCNFFLWDDEAKPREAAAVLNNSRTEPVQNPQTPTRPTYATSPYGLQTPYTDSIKDRQNLAPSLPNTPSKPSSALQQATNTQNTSTTLGTSDEEFYDWPTSDDEDVLQDIDQPSATHNMPPPETPRKALKTDSLATPGKRRFSEMTSGGENTWPTSSDGGDDVFVTPSTGSKMNGILMSGHVTPSTNDTPTPRRFKDMLQAGQDSGLTSEVLKTLLKHDVFVKSDTKAEIKAICDKHNLSTQGIMKGRDISRAMVNTKNEKISELQETIAVLQAERETSRAVIRHLRRDMELLKNQVT
ncbi:MAG: hypothetical protein Q9218_005360 [Villophora microphyllina]